MITAYDDLPIHQTAWPVAHATSGDPSHYERFWFNAYREDLYVGATLGIYPNRGIIDAAFGVVHRGRQRSVFASGRLAEGRDTRVGPIGLEVAEPLRVNRLRVDAPEHGLVADLTYRARTAPVEEPHQTMHDGSRIVMDAHRLTQMGSWTGSLRVAGAAVDLAGGLRGTKDRSWGVRPVGLPAPTAPSFQVPQVFFVWAPLQFDDVCTHYLAFEDGEGRRTLGSAALLPGDGGAGTPLTGRHALRWVPGLRRVAAARIELEGMPPVELEPLLAFRLRGLGYLHPTRGHALWHDELSLAGEDHAVEELDTLDLSCLHVQQVVRARWGERVGLGVLENLAIGPHAPSGFSDLLDGAAG